MLRKTTLLSALLLSACEPYSSPAPNIVSIEPEEVVRGRAAEIALQLDGPLPVRVDYGKRTATLLTPTLRIGGQEVTITRVEQDGTLRATVPTTLPEGQQDVQLALEEGTGSIREQGLTVLPPAPPLLVKEGGNTGPGLPITGIHIEPIADQLRGVPFTVTLRAEGPEAALFEGQVQLSSNKGRLSTNLSQPFRQGVRQEELVLDRLGGDVVLTVRAGDSIIAQSNPFRVSTR